MKLYGTPELHLEEGDLLEVSGPSGYRIFLRALNGALQVHQGPHDLPVVLKDLLEGPKIELRDPSCELHSKGAPTLMAACGTFMEGPDGKCVLCLHGRGCHDPGEAVSPAAPAATPSQGPAGLHDPECCLHGLPVPTYLCKNFSPQSQYENICLNCGHLKGCHAASRDPSET